MSSPDPLSRAERPWWREAPTLVAVVGLLAALVFNTVGVWLQLGQAEQARENTALALLTQLNGLARQAEDRITGVREAICAGNPATPRDDSALIEAAQNYDYLAWLFNADHIRMQSASDYWAPNMLEAYELAVQQHGLPTAQKRFPELNDFKFAIPKSEWVRLDKSCKAVR
jgi:hypothetical protein